MITNIITIPMNHQCKCGQAYGLEYSVKLCGSCCDDKKCERHRKQKEAAKRKKPKISRKKKRSMGESYKKINTDDPDYDSSMEYDTDTLQVITRTIDETCSLIT
jgi:hypothetical protein